MKRLLLVASIAILALSACTRVAPNYQGVLMENYGKNGKSDFKLVKGRVGTMAPGTELFQVPLWEQRAGFEEKLHLKAADNTEFMAQPTYSFTVIEERAIDVVFENKQLDNGPAFMQALEDNILEMRIRDIIKEESRRYTTDTLMANSGSLKFEQDVQDKVKGDFLKKGLKLESFTCQLDFSDKVKAKIDTRNEVNSNITVIDQEIAQQRKKIELARLITEEQKILSEGITDALLKKRAIEGWIEKGCPTPSTIAGTNTGIYIPGIK